MNKDKFTIEFSKRDKIYLSIILCLFAAIVAMAICLPRPYKVVEKEVVVYEPQYKKVYDTTRAYVISPSSTLYSEDGYTDNVGNIYKEKFRKIYVDLGSISSIKVSLSVLEEGLQTKKEIILKSTLSNLIINFDGLVWEIKIDSFIMQNIKTMFALNLGDENVKIVDNYLFEMDFEKANINVLVSYISE